MRKIAAVLGMTVLLWLVPSAGSRGQSTLGDRFSHVDETVFGSAADARLSLARADRSAATAVSGTLSETN